MPQSFKRTLDEFKTLARDTGIHGEWNEDGQSKHTFRAAEGGLLNWWPRTVTVQFQGTLAAKTALEEKLFGQVTAAFPHPSNKPVLKPRQIFIVHGHDLDARDDLEFALLRLNLQPYVLMNESGGGKTIIEALERQIDHDYSSDFGIVLMTPDDVGYAKSEDPDKAEPPARQNVILETGMLLSSLTRKRMAIVVKGHVDIPSDLQGTIQIRYNDKIREIVPKLCQHLKDAGSELDTNAIARASQ